MRTILEVLVPPKSKEIDQKSLSHKETSSCVYDVGHVLAYLNANILVAQLIEVSPIIKKTIQRGVARRWKSISTPITLVARTDVNPGPGTRVGRSFNCGQGISVLSCR